MESHFGKIEGFSSKNETFSEYEERLNFFFEANDVVNGAKERAILLTVIGASLFRLLKDLAMPSTVQELSFIEKKCQQTVKFYSTYCSQALHHAITVVDHFAQQACKFNDTKCYKCERTGHIAKVCRSSTPKRGKLTFKKKHSSDPAILTDDVDNLGLYILHTGKKAPINKPFSFQLDTGVALSVMTEDFHNFFKSVPLQLQVNPESRWLTTINTQCGLFEYQRLCFGILACPSIFLMDILFQGVPNTCVYFDNLYLTGAKNAEHLQTLTQVLYICREKGLVFKQETCAILQDEVNFLGYCLNKPGLQPQEEKLKAIRKAPAPKTVYEGFDDVVETLTLAFSIALLHVLCQPRPRGWRPGQSIQRNVLTRGSRAAGG
ncbi:hypothetical protein RRG08_023026 [Elysia crispata]|uniref:CCHC-type domain-containing protein n=1 Tax=Elysia crispata TaxID=231223 RepID=A0AAE1CN81_9GAST|nr:hypothetical protein RRG08_023026 [Elysia crispata]